MSHPLFDLIGKTALITGSSRALGWAFAEGLAEAGSRVVPNGMNEARLAEEAAEIRSANHEVLASAYDAIDGPAVVAALNSLYADKIEIDILVDNAGIQFRHPMLEREKAHCQDVFDDLLARAFP